MFAARRHGQLVAHAQRIAVRQSIGNTALATGGRRRSLRVREDGHGDRGRSALVTGASRGLGAALARRAGARRARGSCWWRAGEGELERVVDGDPRGRAATPTRFAADVGRQGGHPPHRGRGRRAGRAPRPARPQREHARADAAAPPARHGVRGPRARARRQPASGPSVSRKAIAGGMVAARPRARRPRHLRRVRRTPIPTGAPTASPRRPSITSGASGPRSWRAPACASSPSIPARWTRPCTRRPCRTRIRRRSPIPRAVARRLVDIIRPRRRSRRARASRPRAGRRAQRWSAPS